MERAAWPAVKISKGDLYHLSFFDNYTCLKQERYQTLSKNHIESHASLHIHRLYQNANKLSFYDKNRSRIPINSSAIMLNLNKSIPLLPCELDFASWFLDEASVEFQDRSYDETFLPANQESLSISIAIHAIFDEEAPAPLASHLPGQRGEFVQFYTSQAMKFFSQRCDDLITASIAPPLTSTELVFLDQLLTLAAEDHENEATSRCFDLTLAVTMQNRTILVSAADNYLEHIQHVQGHISSNIADMAKRIRANALDEEFCSTVDIPDYWLMFHLAKRCKNLANRFDNSTPMT